jgi:heme exporter protein D
MESMLPGFAQWFAQWLTMGGYAAFVWPAYAVAGAVLGALAWHAWRAYRVSETALSRLQRRADQASGRSR